MLDLNLCQLNIIKAILKRLVPSAAVLAFGSRVTQSRTAPEARDRRVSQKAKEYSDLDLAVISAAGLSLKEIGDLREAFSDSDLPFEVDIVDWRNADESFKKIILSKYEVLQGENPLKTNKAAKR